jgi:integrase
MAHDIHRTDMRERLAVRVYEPYWRTLDRGQAIGFRKIAADKGYWVARRRPDESSRKYEYASLGEDSKTFSYTQAKAAAEQWFRQRSQGVKSDQVETVADACRAYVKNRRNSKSDECAHDAEKRFERTVYGTAFGDQKLAKVSAEKVREWRDGLKLSPGATNRTLTALKAALNLAVRRKDVTAELSGELRLVEPKPYERGQSKRRELYLSLAQRRALLKAAGETGQALRDLLEAAALTGARAGELVRATVSQFNVREGSMAFITGKQRNNGGRRDVPLSPGAVRLLKRLAEQKAPHARLFVRDDGRPWAHSDWDEPIREAAMRAKLPAEPHTGVCAYTLRHCWITDTLRAGMSVLEVARLAGTSVQMLNDHYGHLVAHAARAKLAKIRLT